MKKIILIVCLGVFSLTTLNAQIEIDRSDLSYAPASFALATDTAFTLPANFEQTGGNRTWDFSSLKAHETQTTRFLTPNAQNGGSSNPECNLVIQIDDTENVFDYMKAEDGLLTTLANTSDSFVSELSRFRLLRFPLVYGDGWTDSNSGTFVYTGADFGAPLDSIKIEVNVQIDNNCDAWGKLTLPLGEKDVLRMRTTVEVNVLVSGLNGQSGWMILQNNNQFDETYLFYAKKAGYWILSVNENDNGGHTFGYRNESLVSVQETAMLELPSFYPNPADNKITVDTKEPLTVKFYSVAGQLIKEYYYDNLGRNTIDISGIQPGAYILKFQNDQGQVGMSKVIVQ